MPILAIKTPAKPFYSHLYVLILDHRGVQPSPQKARASSHRNSRHRRSRRETSFWPPAPSKNAVHVTPTRPLKRGATINGSGVYHGSRLSWGDFGKTFLQSYSKATRKVRARRIECREYREAFGAEVVRSWRYTFDPELRVASRFAEDYRFSEARV
jgi:hypothetical protein